MSDMIEVKVSELEGKALDWAVAYGLNGEPAFFDAFGVRMLGRSITKEVIDGNIRPSSDWSQGGPLIENYQVEILRAGENVLAKLYGLTNAAGEGHTSLVAACRAIVAAKLGDTISVPAELLNHA